METGSDDKIIELCRQGDTAAFDILVQRHGRSLYAFIRSQAGSHAAADELLQETFMKAFENIRSWRGDGSFSAWLHRIAHNLCMDHLRAESRRARTERDFMEAAPAAESVEQAAQGRETATQARAALLSLPGQQRAALLLFASSGLPVVEIARAMGCSRSAAATHLKRAREAVAKHLK